MQLALPKRVFVCLSCYRARSFLRNGSSREDCDRRPLDTLDYTYLMIAEQINVNVAFVGHTVGLPATRARWLLLTLHLAAYVFRRAFSDYFHDY